MKATDTKCRYRYQQQRLPSCSRPGKVHWKGSRTRLGSTVSRVNHRKVPSQVLQFHCSRHNRFLGKIQSRREEVGKEGQSTSGIHTILGFFMKYLDNNGDKLKVEEWYHDTEYGVCDLKLGGALL